ncbi:MAG: hypothetical protein CYPHOPRED_002599 [Cyphobasidiales sp. Tagirdzhanova-0007]|nr:MAG: hypothetical protein CYPHOPRED_002599 [Cyphobasidiales sp. Tagirdzhanova-0007]
MDAFAAPPLTSASPQVLHRQQILLPSLVYLVTGANRGVGRGLVETLLARPNTTVIAAVRNTTNSSSRELSTLKCESGSRCILVKIDAEVDSDPAVAVSKLREEHGITCLDVVLANAGVSYDLARLHEADPELLKKNF